MLIKAYHISPKRNRNSIFEKGLITAEKKVGRIQYSHRIFFSTNKKTLGFDFVGYENVDCWEFKVDKNDMKKDEFSSCKNHFYLEKNIKSNLIKLIKTFV